MYCRVHIRLRLYLCSTHIREHLWKHISYFCFNHSPVKVNDCSALLCWYYSIHTTCVVYVCVFISLSMIVESNRPVLARTHAMHFAYTMANKYTLHILSMIWASIIMFVTSLGGRCAVICHCFNVCRFITKFNECDRSPIITIIIMS